MDLKTEVVNGVLHGVASDGTLFQLEIPKKDNSITMRDQFAMAALTGLLANPISEFVIKDVDVCYEAADAMLKAREE